VSAASSVIDEIRGFARAHPDHPALVVGGRGEAPDEAIGYGALVARAEERARGLAKAGVAAGARCGLVAPQGAGFVEAALGILAADACLVPIPDGASGAALERAARESALHHLVEAARGSGCRSFAGVRDVDGSGERIFRSLDPAYLRFTSGTTSARKGVIVGHAAVADRLANANAALGISPDDRILWLLPMAHHFLVSILLYLRQGATILLPASNFARDVLALAGRARASVFYASPYHYGLLAKDDSSLGLEAVRLAVSTADGLRADVANAFRARFSLPLVQALGIIEVGLPVVNRESADTKPEALGRPGAGYEVWLRDEDGTRVEDPGPARTGEICIRGSGLFDAYLEPWTPARTLLVPDGFRTGDQGWLDADGDLHLAGRRANRINMAGMKFFAEEVEAVLDAHPGVRLSRVRAREHAHLGEIPVAEFVPADPEHVPDKRELLQHCRERLAGYKVPRELRPVAALPVTPTGKLRRSDADRRPGS
jgi:long-chain acyl-CoA synthetase